MTVLSSIRFDGEKAFTTYQGGTTGERFVQYLKETLIPTLRPGGIVVMDNLHSHPVKAVRKILEAGRYEGAQPACLQSGSQPD